MAKFDREARVILQDATKVARELGAPAVEAEHLLLAATRRDDPAARVLRDAGLDYDGLSAALEAETARSLGAAGVTASAPRFSPFTRTPRWSTSAKSALERSVKVTVAQGKRGITTRHMVLAILAPARGTVPRALECAGVDRAELTARVQTAQ